MRTTTQRGMTRSGPSAPRIAISACRDHSTSVCPDFDINTRRHLWVTIKSGYFSPQSLSNAHTASIHWLHPTRIQRRIQRVQIRPWHDGTPLQWYQILALLRLGSEDYSHLVWTVLSLSLFTTGISLVIVISFLVIVFSFHLSIHSAFVSEGIFLLQIKENLTMIQFGYRLCLLQRRNKREVLGNILNCPPLIGECLDPPRDVAP